MNNFKRITLYIMNITDIIALLCAFLISYLIRFRVMMQTSGSSAERISLYTVLLMSILISYFFVNIFFLYNDDFLKRKNGKELLASLKMIIYVAVLVILFLFLTKASDRYSRAQFITFIVLGFFIDYSGRILVKDYVLPKYRKGDISEKIVLVASMSQIGSLVDKLNKPYNWNFQISGLIVADMNLKGETISGIPVISNMVDIYQDLSSAEVDSVYMNLDDQEYDIKSCVEKIQNIGKTVHVNVKEYDYGFDNKVVDKVGAYAVVTYSPVYQRRKRQIVFKRCLDILLAILCVPIYLVFYLIFGLLTELESPGRILMAYVRVGKNGRRFYQYRFRILRMDAKARMSKGKSPYTIAGRFLKYFHIDGLPMIFNVIYGDMSFVGPKAPTLQEFLTYSSRQRKNMCATTGVVGFWNKNLSVEDVNSAEYDYIENWNLIQEVILVFEMILRYITFHSAREFTPDMLQEAIQKIDLINQDRDPLPYDHSTYERKTGILFYAYLGVKRTIDVIGSLVGIIVLSPVFLILGALVIADDGGNPFYGHERIGQRGKRITVYKFRSMRKDAGDLKKLLTPEQLEQYEREFKIDNDPRITKVGNFIRKTSLDELPQLFNILKGDISIIGPRPIVEKETQIYGTDVAKFLSVKPGLTGYWQAYARNNATYESGERQSMEMYYVDHQSLWVDIKIFFKTITSVLKGEGAQ